MYLFLLAPMNTSGCAGSADPCWLDKGDNAWEMVCASLMSLQSMPGMLLLYGSIVKKKWAINSAFMTLYAFSVVLVCWVAFGYSMAFGEFLIPMWGRAAPALSRSFLLSQGNLTTAMVVPPKVPNASVVSFQFGFAAMSAVIISGAVTARMALPAWAGFVPIWLTFSYTVGAFSLWGGGFLFKWGVLDYAGGYVVHLSAGVTSIVLSYWVGPRIDEDRERFPPNNVVLMLAGAGLLWIGWTGFNGGNTYAADTEAALAVLNTHLCTSTSLLVWILLDVIYHGRPSVIGSVQGMMAGLVAITPAAGLVQGWAAICIGLFSGGIPWTTLLLHKRSTSKFLQRFDDTIGVFHTHGISALLGGLLTGVFAHPQLTRHMSPVAGSKGLIYGGGIQIVKQIVGALFIIAWNIFITTLICALFKRLSKLRMSDEELQAGDDAVHGEEAYAVWADGEKYSFALGRSVNN